MNKRYDFVIEIMMLLFLTAMTLSFSAQLPDMDFMPRMLTSSFFLPAFVVIGFMAIKKNNFLLPASIFRNLTVILFSAFFLVVFKSWFNSINPTDSLFEVIKFLIAFAYLIIFPVIFFKCVNPLKAISRGVLLSLSVVLIAGIMQLSDVMKDAKKHHEQFAWDYHISSLLSTKNSLAEYLLLVLPLIIYTVIYDKGIWKIAAIINGTCCLLYIYFLKSFSVFIALAAVLLTISVLLFAVNKKHLQVKTGLSKKAFNLVTVAVFTTFLLALFLTMNKADGFDKLNLATTYISGKAHDSRYNNNSVFERMLLWRNSVSMIKEHPLAGVGLSNWKLFFPSYGYSGAAYLNSDSVKFTRPHNDFLQIFAETGVLGFIFYLLFFICTAYLIIKNYLKTRVTTWLVLLSGIISYFIISLFGFPMERVMILLLLIIYASLTITLNAKLNDTKKFRFPKAALTSVVLSIALSLFSIKICLARLRAESIYKRMLYQKEHRNFQRMYQISKGINAEYFPVDYTATPISWYKATALYTNNYLKESIPFYEQALKVAPYHVQVNNDMGAAYMNAGDNEKAKKYFSKALSINPDFYEARLNETFAVFNSGNKYGAYKMFKDLNAGIPKRPKYADNLKVIINAIADSVFRSQNIDAKANPKWAMIYNKSYIWSIEQRADSARTSFIELLNNEINLYR